MSAPIPAQFGFSLSMIIQCYAKGSLRLWVGKRT
jgi:hypothetical protein